MSFGDVRGQDRAVRLLRNAISQGRLSHSYIFAGPDGCGKKLLALNFAKALNCEKEGNKPCDSCPSCRSIDNGTYPDVRWVRKEQDGTRIRIRQIRELERDIALKPYGARYKVFIIVDAGEMNVEAQNSFLKTLEEPPRNSVLVLICRRPDDLLPTVVSRSQVVWLRPSGRYEFSVSDPDILDEFSDDSCIENYSAGDREELSGKLKMLAAWYRDLLIFKATRDEGLLINTDKAGPVREKSESLSADRLLAAFDSVVGAKENIDRNVNPKLALSAMFKHIL